MKNFSTCLITLVLAGIALTSCDQFMDDDIDSSHDNPYKQGDQCRNPLQLCRVTVEFFYDEGRGVISNDNGEKVFVSIRDLTNGGTLVSDTIHASTPYFPFTASFDQYTRVEIQVCHYIIVTNDYGWEDEELSCDEGFCPDSPVECEL